jgi:hypothetical protein
MNNIRTHLMGSPASGKAREQCFGLKRMTDLAASALPGESTPIAVPRSDDKAVRRVGIHLAPAQCSDLDHRISGLAFQHASK